VLVTAVIAGFLKLWDSSLPLGWDVLGFVFLAATAFAALQAGLLRLLGVRAMAILGPLYLVAPAVAGQVPELLNPAYRALLWSWTPFRFFAEGLRSLLQGTPAAPDVATGIWVLAGMLVVGLVVVVWPGRRASAGEKAEPHTPDRVVEVGVH
jgi:ABC-type multidrug transport system permease subunit